jgi:hypothetical protein
MRDHDARLRRLERGAIAALTGLGSLLLMGQVIPRARAVEAESFVLRDAQGNVRAVLGFQDGNAVALTLKSAAGEDRVAVTVRGDGTSLVRALDRGKAGVELGSRTDGTGVTVLDRGGRTRAAIAVSGDGRAAVTLGESSTKDRVRLSLTPTGAAGLRFLDAGGTEHVALTADGEGTPELVLSDVAGRPRTTLDVAVDGTTRIDLTDPSGRSRAAMAVTGGGVPSIVLTDDAGQPSFQVPPGR